MKTNHFTVEQIGRFNSKGYVFLPRFLSPKRLSELRVWIEDILSWPEIPLKYMRYYEEKESNSGKSLVNRIENFIPYHEKLKMFCTDSELLECLAELFGGEAILFKDKINVKPPGGKGFTPHQDSAAGWENYTKLFITAMIPIDENTPENGCLEISPENYGRTLISEEWRAIGGEKLKLIDWQPMPMKPSDVLFFDSYMPHQSYKNCTEHPRRNLYLTFNLKADGDFRERYFVDKRKNYPPNYEREPGKSYSFKV